MPTPSTNANARKIAIIRFRLTRFDVCRRISPVSEYLFCTTGTVSAFFATSFGFLIFGLTVLLTGAGMGGRPSGRESCLFDGSIAICASRTSSSNSWAFAGLKSESGAVARITNSSTSFGNVVTTVEGAGIRSLTC